MSVTITGTFDLALFTVDMAGFGDVIDPNHEFIVAQDGNSLVVTNIPEPASVALFGVAGLMLALRRRR